MSLICMGKCFIQFVLHDIWKQTTIGKYKYAYIVWSCRFTINFLFKIFKSWKGLI